MTIRILVVDDEPRVCTSLEGLLKDEGYIVTSCHSGEEGLEFIQNGTYDVVLLDVMLPGKDGLEVLEQIRKLAPKTKVLMMSGQADLSLAVRATKLGAHNFFEKPLNPDRVLLALKNIAEQMILERKVDSLEYMMDRDDRLVGESPVMQLLKETIAKTAPTEGRVLIYGENGTGKELVARAIHRGSRRKERPFVSLNCAALPQELVESELFGHERGAFTGAIRKKPGRFEIADGGTLFLDEIGDMDLDTQAKLLRVLEENEAVRVGGESPFQFNVRIISATNKNLTDEIQKRRFREDLFYRLNVIPIEVPPLRERQNDCILLAYHFLKRISEQTGMGMKQWGKGAVELLQTYSWPGNIRELKNFIERLVIMNTGDTISEDEVVRVLPVSAASVYIRESSVPGENLSFREMVEAYERELLIHAFQKAEGNVSQIARTLRIDRTHLYRKLKNYGIK
jgi:two-component system nitrogen regulation response regulator NtrX